jgi:hypothetical protein
MIWRQYSECFKSWKHFTLLSYTYPMLNTVWELAMADAILFLNLMHVLPSNEEIPRPTPCSSSTYACRHNLLLPHISCSVFLMATTSNRLHMSQPLVFMEAPTTLRHSGMALYASTYSDLERGDEENGWTVYWTKLLTNNMVKKNGSINHICLWKAYEPW